MRRFFLFVVIIPLMAGCSGFGITAEKRKEDRLLQFINEDNARERRERLRAPKPAPVLPEKKEMRKFHN